MALFSGHRDGRIRATAFTDETQQPKVLHWHGFMDAAMGGVLATALDDDAQNLEVLQ